MLFLRLAPLTKVIFLSRTYGEPVWGKRASSGRLSKEPIYAVTAWKRPTLRGRLPTRRRVGPRALIPRRMECEWRHESSKSGLPLHLLASLDRPSTAHLRPAG